MVHPVVVPASKTRQAPSRQPLRKLGLVALLAVAGLVNVAVEAKSPESGFSTVGLYTLPTEAQRTQRLILSGGPFPYGKDGVTFGNYERRLPRRERGFYREYTVPTPGSSDRGARRIICGGARPTLPEFCYYTADHYASFKRIAY